MWMSCIRGYLTNSAWLKTNWARFRDRQRKPQSPSQGTKKFTSRWIWSGDECRKAGI
ncbi:hypothetical protein K438DRAFT_1821725 [Mycena galopus ATCC 62051]|nr:hypothetical protein K438DRAFT_1821725 [Mycena galopus ATCC 62051]